MLTCQVLGHHDKMARTKKHTQRTTQKLAENQDATDIQ